VTLRGTVGSFREKREAANAAKGCAASPRSTTSAGLDAEALSIDTFDGIVTLSGSVDSGVERDAAVNAAWAAPGVRLVDDEIVVNY